MLTRRNLHPIRSPFACESARAVVRPADPENQKTHTQLPKNEKEIRFSIRFLQSPRFDRTVCGRGRCLSSAVRHVRRRTQLWFQDGRVRPNKSAGTTSQSYLTSRQSTERMGCQLQRKLLPGCSHWHQRQRLKTCLCNAL